MELPIIPTGDFVLPVCVSDDNDISTLLSALDLYRVLRNDKKPYPIFDAVWDALYYTNDPYLSPCLEVSQGSTLGSCFRMDTSTDIFDFYPNDPFVLSDNQQTAVGMRWMRFQDIVNGLELPDWIVTLLDNLGEYAGYFPNDCFIAYNDISDGFGGITNLWDYIRNANLFPFPSVTFKLQGEGQMEIQFAQVPLGGSVLVTNDIDFTISELIDIATGNFGELDNWTLLELSRDVIGIPPELVTTINYEIELVGDIEHTVRCFFVPTINPDQFPFVFPFGGIREIEFCGDISVIGSQSGETYTINNYRMIQATRGGYVMATVDDICAGMICAMEEVAKRILLASSSENIEGGVGVGASGGITYDKDTQGALVQSEISGSSNEIAFGGAMGVGEGFRDFVAEIILKRTTQAKTAQEVADALRRVYFLRGLVDAVDLLASAFGTPYTNATNTVTPTVIPQAIAEIIFCYGLSKKALNKYADEVEDGGGTDASDIAAWYRLLIDEIEDDQLEQWYRTGTLTPRVGYSSAPCYRLPAQSFDYTNLNYSQYSVLWITGAGSGRKWRMEITVQEPLEDAAGNKWDGIYWKPYNGAATSGSNYKTKLVNTAGSNSVIMLTVPPYLNGAGKYVVEFEAPTFAIGGTVTAFNWSPIKGKITYKIFDLGEV